MSKRSVVSSTTCPTDIYLFGNFPIGSAADETSRLMGKEEPPSRRNGLGGKMRTSYLHTEPNLKILNLTET
jgi:hypothetical protein